MARAYVSVGSNVDREGNVTAALDALSAAYGALSPSSVFESEAVGFEGQPFYNLVVGFDTADPVGELAATLRGIERACGRDRDAPRFSSRTLDLDLLTYADVAGTVDGVPLPRREITEQAFVLLPLAEIAGDELHPVLKRSYAELWERFDMEGPAPRPVHFEWDGVPISRQAATAVDGDDLARDVRGTVGEKQ